jgi:short-subunit dehydrogenase
MSTTFLTAVVTGAASALGIACAEHLALQGYDLILIDADRHRLNALADDLTTRTRKSVEVYQADTSCPAAITALVRKIQEDESISLLVNLSDADDVKCFQDGQLICRAASDIRQGRRDAQLLQASIVVFRTTQHHFPRSKP